MGGCFICELCVCFVCLVSNFWDEGPVSVSSIWQLFEVSEEGKKDQRVLWSAPEACCFRVYPFRVDSSFAFMQAVDKPQIRYSVPTDTLKCIS